MKLQIPRPFTEKVPDSRMIPGAPNRQADQASQRVPSTISASTGQASPGSSGDIIDTSAALVEACRQMRDVRILGVDTETNGLYAYKSRVCIIQISDGTREWLIDAMAFSTDDKQDGNHPHGLTPLLDIFGDPSVLKILHGASHDIASLKEDFGRAITNVFDTYIAAQLLGYEKTGLSNLVERHFGKVLSKKLQKADWGLRPLSADSCEYLRHDVQFLLRLYDIIMTELKAASLVEEAVIESHRIEETSATQPRFDPEGFWRIKGIDDLHDEGLALLQTLYDIRNRLSAEADRPAFKMIPDSILVTIATARSHAEFNKISFLQKRSMQPFLQELKKAFDATRDGKRPIRARRLRLPRRHAGESSAHVPGSLNKTVRDKMETALKDWRRAESVARGVSTMAVLPNHLIDVFLFSPPRSLQSIAEIPHFGSDRFQRYGVKLFELMTKVLAEEHHS